MTIFVTNIWNHYMTTICRWMAECLGKGEFRAVLVSPVDEEGAFRVRKGMSWDMRGPDEDWLLRNPQTVKELERGEWIGLIEFSDVAVIDSLFYNKKLLKAVDRRVKSGRLTFFSNERFFKKAVTVMDCINPANWIRWMKMHRRFNRPNVHYLPMSHWGVDDMRFYDACKGRIWKWGYFPEVSDTPIDKPARGKLRIGWAGRMVDWKHVECIIKAASLLGADARSRCVIELVGDGDQKEYLVAMAEKLGISDIMSFRGYLTVTNTMEFMRKLDVYVLPSDRGEGWGVVLAEAMDKCCVPIACVEAGATLNLIEDGENGFVFECGDAKRVATKIQWLLEHPVERKAMGRRAWERMQRHTPKIAAERLVQLISAIQSNRPEDIPSEGLCSKER